MKPSEIKTNNPVKIFEAPDFAPEFTLRVDRVREPEAGIPEKKAHPKFAIPKDRDSRSL